jgi:hypothetical protein
VAEGKRIYTFSSKSQPSMKENRITTLKKSDGQMTEDLHEISNMSHNFFGNLYESEGTHGMDQVLNPVLRKVTTMMNEVVTSPYNEAEVKTAMFSNVSH